jgi:hypothetical protein
VRVLLIYATLIVSFRVVLRDRLTRDRRFNRVGLVIVLASFIFALNYLL